MTAHHLGPTTGWLRPLLLALLLVLSACGSATSPAASTADEDLGAGPADAERTWTSAVIVALERPKPDVVVATLEVAAGARGCASNPVVHVAHQQYRNGLVTDLSASHDTRPDARSATGDTGAGPCPDRDRTRVEVEIPARTASLTTNYGHVTWEPGPDTSWVPCSAAGCDPPTDTCDPAWTATLTRGVELPPEQDVDVLACADGWLVADVDAVVTGCQGVDGATPPPGCTDHGVHRRWFARFDGDQWQTVASGTAGGCADVADVPRFPRDLCRGLAAR